ncbi:divergent polysaccharide deacetylase family protein [Treponema brennaborense]|uniref:Divergent polysaccharide deacetylase family protein n=1 Tax=Treponema brennaborense (strain DSM 12168 / CIP 105900 / DD5/3) TaxID=906968 RepID=F4LIM4_TREBD|nr:divergent polysaccharide deacetylase family protein [Treponema brennaborense]AEE17249.1 protein of unknown function DUF610 YibQ [Treponema brennaborense DSM 12168]
MDKKKKRRRTRKPKVVLPRKQVFILTAAIAAVCICMLCVAVLTAPPAAEDFRQPPAVSPSVPAPVTPQTPVSPSVSVQPPISVQPSVEQQPAKQTSPTEPVSVPEPSLPIVPKEPVPPVHPEFDLIPTAAPRAVLVFIFDDGGQNLDQLQPFLNLPFPVSIAVMPELVHSVESAKRVRAAGKELLLHQPMQAKNLAVNPGPGAIHPDMDRDAVRKLLHSNLQKIGPVAGMNNHEGSLITESVTQMDAVLDVCAAEGIFFLDSRTTADTQVPAVAAARGMKIWERDIFLDNTPDRRDILDQLYRGAAIANKKGYAVMIGHVWSPQLASILNELYPLLKKKGYTFSGIRGLYEDFGN